MTRIVLADAPIGAIVLVGDEWGVVCTNFTLGYQIDPRRWRIVDFWHGGRHKVPATTLVDV